VKFVELLEIKHQFSDNY